MDTVTEVLRKEIEKRGTQVAVAKWLGVSQGYVSEILNGTRNPGPAVLKKLGLKKETIYRKAS